MYIKDYSKTREQTSVCEQKGEEFQSSTCGGLGPIQSLPRPYSSHMVLSCWYLLTISLRDPKHFKGNTI